MEEAQGLALGPTPQRSMAVTRVRAHGFAFDGNSAVCTGVGATLGIFQPSAVPFSHVLGRSNIRWDVRPLFNLVSGVLSLCWAGRIRWRWFGGTNHLTAVELPRLLSMQACTRTNGRDWVSDTASGVSVYTMAERRALVGHVIGRRMS